jgi:uncharacterized protein (DUF1499 family)
VTEATTMGFAKWALIVAVALPLTVILAGRMGALSGRPPGDLGVREGRLKAPSTNPNSVSSQADLHPGHPMREAARIAPLALRGDGPATMARLRKVVEAMPGSHVAASEPGYLRVEFSTALLRFVDDAEFWFDPAGQVVQVRSAARLGRRDFDVNRQRIEAIRARLAEAP